MKTRASIELSRMTANEAAHLMVHHMRIASALFENCPEDNCATLRNLIDRQFEDNDGARDAAKVYVVALEQFYAAMSRECPPMLTAEEKWLLEEAAKFSGFTPHSESVKEFAVSLAGRGLVMESDVYPVWYITDAGRRALAEKQ